VSRFGLEAIPLSLHLASVLGGLLLYVVTTHLRREHRRSAAAIAWVLLICLLPYVAVPLYLIFGTRKLRPPGRHGSRHAAVEPAVDQALAVPDAGLASRAPRWAAATLRGMGVAPPVMSESVVFHEDGLQSLASLRDLIDAARERIDLSTYLWRDDAIGVDIATRLAQAAGRGVQVRVLIDGFGGFLTSRLRLRRLREAGVQVRWFMPMLRWSPRGHANARCHRKVAIADGRLCWVGGRNLGAEYFTGRYGHAPWVDLTFEARGGVALQALEMFDATWAHASGARSMASRRLPAESAMPAGAHAAQVIASGPDQDEDTIYALLLTALYRAESRVVAVTPYFVPDDGLLEAMRHAAGRGVAVELLLPARSNHPLADIARHRALRSLAHAGVTVRFAPTMLHAKLVVIDASMALCGSVNLDGRSLFLNFESMVAFYDAQDITWLQGWAVRASANARTYPAQRPSIFRDTAEGLLLWLAFQL
jgi:cardiolipin synthase